MPRNRAYNTTCFLICKEFFLSFTKKFLESTIKGRKWAVKDRKSGGVTAKKGLKQIMELKVALEKLQEMEKTNYALRHASSVLYVDGDTAAPKNSWKGRGKALGFLSELSYRQLVNEETGEMLDTILANREQVSEMVYRQAEVLKEDYDDLHVIPMAEYVAWQELVNEANAVWHDAKVKSDYAMFAPLLEKLIAQQTRIAQLKGKGKKKPYDVLLDDYEKGASMEMLDPFFKTIREELTPLILEIAKKPAIGMDPEKCVWPVEQQRRFSERIMAMEGLDPDNCTLGETEHPFTDGVNKWDVRITTHYHEENALQSMFSVIHEGGHALYELGVADELQFTSLSGGATMGIHESQSRFFENLICRSRAFCKPLLKVMQEVFPEQMKGVTEEALYAGINRAQPSLIRTEADELTYSLHVMIRYELEKAIFAGELKVAELPGVWNELYHKYLGVRVPDDRHGILQDSHWAGGMFGYFPSYALGSAYGVQMLHQMEKDMDVWAVAETGDLRPINAWLDEKVHRFGRLKKPADILLGAMGGPLDARVYTAYLKKKYGELYGIC